MVDTDRRKDTSRVPSTDAGDWFYQIIHGFKRNAIEKRVWRDDKEEHLFDEGIEVNEQEFDMIRTKVWTKDLEDATQAWYKCKRQKGITNVMSCWEEGEALRRAHWRHQLQIEESGCNDQMYAYGKCFQRAERDYVVCRRYEWDFKNCIIQAGNMNLVPETPIELKRPEQYKGLFILDQIFYSRWIKKRNEFLDNHPDWFAEADVEIMNPKQLKSFIMKGKPWLDQPRVKPWSTYAYPQRYREFVSKKDLIVE